MIDPPVQPSPAAPTSSTPATSHSNKAALYVVLALVLLAVVGAGAYYLGKTQQTQQAYPAAAQSVSPTISYPSPTDSKVSFSEDLFLIQTPGGWIKSDPLQQSQYRKGEKSFYYEDMSGNYFMVIIDPGGRGFGSDLTWEYEPEGDGFVFKEEHECTNKESPYCLPGDNQLTIGIKGGQIRDHFYFFIAGNNKREEGVDLQVFRKIVESFKAK